MPSIYVKPRPGGRVRMPERNFQPMAEKGAWVPRIDYYERLLIGGDVVITDPPTEPTLTPEPTEPAAPKSAAARGPASSKEK